MGNILLTFLAPLARKTGRVIQSDETIALQPGAICLCVVTIVMLLLTAPEISWTAP